MNVNHRDRNHSERRHLARTKRARLLLVGALIAGCGGQVSTKATDETVAAGQSAKQEGIQSYLVTRVGLTRSNILLRGDRQIEIGRVIVEPMDSTLDHLSISVSTAPDVVDVYVSPDDIRIDVDGKEVVSLKPELASRDAMLLPLSEEQRRLFLILAAVESDSALRGYYPVAPNGVLTRAKDGASTRVTAASPRSCLGMGWTCDGRNLNSCGSGCQLTCAAISPPSLNPAECRGTRGHPCNLFDQCLGFCWFGRCT